MTEHPNLATAMLAARLELPAIPKTAKNPHFGNKYAPLGEVLAVVVPAYGAHGVLLTTEGEGEGWLRVVATHVKTGETKHCGVQIIGAGTMQNLGGAFTYGQRYGYGALLSLELEDDDDGNRASEGRAQAAVAAPGSAQGRTEAPRPTPKPPGTPNASQGKGGGQKGGPAPAAQDDDQEAVWFMAEQLDAHAAETGNDFRIVRDGKLGVYGKVAQIAGVDPGKYSMAQLASRGALPKLRGFYEYLCGKNDLAVWTATAGPSKVARHEAPADVQDLTDPNDLPF